MLAPVPRSGLSLLLGAFALLGLFAMHGLSSHGAEQHDRNPAASTLAPDHPDHAHPHAEASASPAADRAHTGCSEGHCGGMDGLVLVLCLAVLAAGLAVALFVVLLRPAVVAAVRPLAAAVTLPRVARDRDPPCLFDLSVQRC